MEGWESSNHGNWVACGRTWSVMSFSSDSVSSLMFTSSTSVSGVPSTLSGMAVTLAAPRPATGAVLTGEVHASS